jgi:hypothetical protein
MIPDDRSAGLTNLAAQQRFSYGKKQVPPLGLTPSVGMTVKVIDG